MAPAANGASLYATQGSTITQFDFATGSVLNSTPLSGAWGITRNSLDGNLYVVNWLDSQAGAWFTNMTQA